MKIRTTGVDDFRAVLILPKQFWLGKGLDKGASQVVSVRTSNRQCPLSLRGVERKWGVFAGRLEYFVAGEVNWLTPRNGG